MNCPECHEPLRNKGMYGMAGVETVTLVGYGSPEGHDHDDNCRKRTYGCINGHDKVYSIINKCPTCNWTGKTECFCSAKVEKWPDAVENE